VKRERVKREKKLEERRDTPKMVEDLFGGEG